MKISKITTTIFLLLLSSVIFTGCAPYNKSEGPVTQLQVREYQSREFDTDDTKLVMKSMMNVLQDEGFIIKNAVADLGLLSAEKSYDVENTGKAILLCALNKMPMKKTRDP